VDVRIRLSGEVAQAALVELRAWLSREDSLRGRVSAERPVIPPGQMGPLVETLIVAVGAQGAVTALAKSLATWIRHRRPSVDIELTGADGRQVKIAARDADIDVARLIHEITGTDENGAGTADQGGQ
jgi:hypothetical protein